ncbi:DUF6879 family protein [Streptomyces sp. FR-108]|uniref:DUF6879 family protein n=1 Tax=Streptomyces sp. FR-108 TaxID=3416665 RepID=UPI003CE71C6E
MRPHHFTGDGDPAGQEISDDPVVAELCAESFEAVGARAIPHDQYAEARLPGSGRR